MSTVDERLREVEIQMSAVKQRVEDHERDVIQFAPMVTDLHAVRWTLDQYKVSLDSAHTAIRELGHRIDTERDERIKGQAERKAEMETAIAERESQHKDLRLKYVQVMIGIVGIFVTTLGGVVIAYLTRQAG